MQACFRGGGGEAFTFNPGMSVFLILWEVLWLIQFHNTILVPEEGKLCSYSMHVSRHCKKQFNLHKEFAMLQMLMGLCYKLYSAVTIMYTYQDFYHKNLRNGKNDFPPINPIKWLYSKNVYFQIWYVYAWVREKEVDRLPESLIQLILWFPVSLGLLQGDSHRN